MEKFTFQKAVIIDDDPLDTYICSEILKHSEEVKEYITFNKPVDALKYLEGKISIYEIEQDFPDLIFLDLNMPQLDGWEFIEKYKTFPTEITTKTKLFVLTSSKSNFDIRKAEEVDILSGYMVKPITTQMVYSLNHLGKFMPF